LVRVPQRSRRVGARDDHAGLLQLRQALGQDGRRDVAEVVLELGEATRTAEQGVDDAQRPPVPDAGEREIESVAGPGHRLHLPCSPPSVPGPRIALAFPGRSVVACDSQVTCFSQVRIWRKRMSLTEELEQAAGRAAQAAGPSVVRIGRGRGRGAGVVVGDGVVLTNAHNLRGTETTVTFADGRVVTAADVDGDLAVLAVDTAGAPVIAWAPDSELRLGTPVFALANPAGQGVRVGFGTVSAVGRSFRGPRGRRVTGSVEHTAPLGRGSSGGPLVDVEGRLVGV